jgi:hypothetical protein
LTRFFKESPCYDLKQIFAFHLRTDFVLSHALHGSGHHNVSVFLFLKDFFKAASGPPFPENISSTFFYSKVGMDAKIDCNLLTPFPNFQGSNLIAF